MRVKLAGPRAGSPFDELHHRFTYIFGFRPSFDTASYECKVPSKVMGRGCGPECLFGLLRLCRPAVSTIGTQSGEKPKHGCSPRTLAQVGRFICCQESFRKPVRTKETFHEHEVICYKCWTELNSLFSSLYAVGDPAKP